MENKHYQTFGELWLGDTLYGITLYYNANAGIVVDHIFEQEYYDITHEPGDDMLSNEQFKRVWLTNSYESLWIGQKDRNSTFVTTQHNNTPICIGETENTVRTFYFLDKNVIPAIIAYYAVMVQDAIHKYQEEAERMFIFADKILAKLADWGEDVTYKMGDCISLTNKPNWEIIKTKRECPE